MEIFDKKVTDVKKDTDDATPTAHSSHAPSTMFIDFQLRTIETIKKLNHQSSVISIHGLHGY